MYRIGKSTNQGMNWLVYSLPLVLILLVQGCLAGRARAAVTLVSFTATGMGDHILVEWETASEFEIAGFFVQASDQLNGTYTRISDIYDSVGGLTGTTYSYSDYQVTLGVTKYYRLESIDANTQASEFSDPISGLPDVATATATNTTTATSTPTPTETSTSEITPTSTVTPTPTPTETDSSAYPAPPTATSPYPGIATTVAPYPGVPTTAVPAVTATNSNLSNQTAVPTNPILTSTAEPQNREFAIPDTDLQGTLVPLPSITIRFVEGTPVKPATGIANSERLAQGNQSTTSSGWSRYGTLGFILLIWALLGVWFWLSFRKLE
jgi:hypothetical protein